MAVRLPRLLDGNLHEVCRLRPTALSLQMQMNATGVATMTLGLSDAAPAMHAWVEIYFQGFGWLPFDPTPGTGFVPDGLGGSPQQESSDSSDDGTQDNPNAEPDVSPSPEMTPSPSPTWPAAPAPAS